LAMNTSRAVDFVPFAITASFGLMLTVML